MPQINSDGQGTHLEIVQLCECSDSGCGVHKGTGSCLHDAETTLYRVDMIDRTGVRFCVPCAEDAMESGLFDIEKNFYS